MYVYQAWYTKKKSSFFTRNQSSELLCGAWLFSVESEDSRVLACRTKTESDKGFNTLVSSHNAALTFRMRAKGGCLKCIASLAVREARDRRRFLKKNINCNNFAEESSK